MRPSACAIYGKRGKIAILGYAKIAAFRSEVPASGLNDTERKGWIRMAQAVHFDAGSFQAARAAGGVLVVDFFATWCMPCKMLGPVIEQLAADYEGKAVVGKVDIDQQRELAEEYRVQSVPTVIIFQDGEPADTLVGARPIDTLKAAIDKLL